MSQDTSKNIAPETCRKECPFNYSGVCTNPGKTCDPGNEPTLEDQATEVKQTIRDSYEQTFDLDLAYEKANCSLELIEFLNKDESFQRSLKTFLIIEKENIVKAFRDAMKSADPKISFPAAKELARIFYPEFNTRGEKGGKIPITAVVELPFESLPQEEQDRLSNEYKELHGGE